MRALILWLLTVLSLPGQADQALAAVAANFADPVGGLVDRFEAETGHKIRVATGATGALTAQIVQGAPYDLLLAADQARPERLVQAGLALADSRFTYAQGQLTLWSPDPARLSGDGEAVLTEGAFQRLALANPALAPYGEAAMQVLSALGVAEPLRDRLVMGENIGQTFALVATGNAELGFVALAQVVSPRRQAEGSRWDVPQHLYPPIRQDAVLLTRARNNTAARAFLAWLATAQVQSRLGDLGYAVD
ncbi:MAG: molybdate ABC transporter substrate-binding protein [Rhodothalassiaceae bacterium]